MTNEQIQMLRKMAQCIGGDDLVPHFSRKPVYPPCFGSIFGKPKCRDDDCAWCNLFLDLNVDHAVALRRMGKPMNPLAGITWAFYGDDRLLAWRIDVVKKQIRAFAPAEYARKFHIVPTTRETSWYGYDTIAVFAFTEK